MNIKKVCVKLKSWSILIDSAKVANFDYKLYENFHFGQFYEKMYFGTMKRYEKYSLALEKTRKGKKHDKDRDRETFKRGMEDAEKDMERHKKEMGKWEYDTSEKSSKAGVDLYMQLLKLDEDLPKKTVDSNGNYSMNIDAGIYYVYIKSKNRTDLIMPETDGKVYIKKVKISENSDKDVSYNFEL